MKEPRHVIDSRTRNTAEEQFKTCTRRVERAPVNHPALCGYFGPRDDVKLAPSEVRWRLY